MMLSSMICGTAILKSELDAIKYTYKIRGVQSPPIIEENDAHFIVKYRYPILGIFLS